MKHRCRTRYSSSKAWSISNGSNISLSGQLVGPPQGLCCWRVGNVPRTRTSGRVRRWVARSGSVVPRSAAAPSVAGWKSKTRPPPTAPAPRETGRWWRWRALSLATAREGGRTVRRPATGSHCTGVARETRTGRTDGRSDGRQQAATVHWGGSGDRHREGGRTVRRPATGSHCTGAARETDTGREDGQTVGNRQPLHWGG